MPTCAFEKAILARCYSCAKVEKHYVAERESIICTDVSARNNCLSLHQLLQHNSTFALKHIHEKDPLTHAQETKMQCGGLAGLQNVIHGTEMVADVVSLIDAAFRIFGTLESLPYMEIVQAIASYKIRKRQDAH